MRLYACIISPDIKTDKAVLVSVAQQFSYTIELLDDGILFDVSGLQNLVGNANKISQSILDELKTNSVSGSIAVAETTDAAILLARGNPISSDPGSAECHIASSEDFTQLPLQNLLIGGDTLNVFRDLGIKSISDLQQVPKDDLIRRYGQQFKNVIDIIERKGGRLLTPNAKENTVSWSYQLDFPVDDFEQLVFILNHGLDDLLSETSGCGFSTEHLDLSFTLQNKTERTYQIKTSFPTLEKTFWLKLINLRISLDPPESGIVAIRVTSHFTPPRPAQRGLYAVSRPDPERLLLTVNKLKKLVGEENVGVPVLLDQRVEKAFDLNADGIPGGKENAESLSSAECGMRNAEFEHLTSVDSSCISSPSDDGADSALRTPHSALERDSALHIPHSALERDSALRIPHSAFLSIPNPIVAFSYFNPPVQAEVLVRDKKLIFLRTQFFSGHVTKCSGIWKANSKWWDRSWKAQEWDVEIEGHGIYRLCKVDKEWFLAGEYD
jgi:hypothetical protein